jgi:very-short-patch-repair endonuclease
MRLSGSVGARRAAKRLRKEMTSPEISLWLALRQNGLGLRFRRQHAASGYVLDFYCAPARLAIEVDGEAHNRGDRPLRDSVRDRWLFAQDTHVLRYSASDVLSNLEGVVREIMTIALERRRDCGADRDPPPPSGCACHLPLAGEECSLDPPPPGGGGAEGDGGGGVRWR